MNHIIWFIYPFQLSTVFSFIFKLACKSSGQNLISVWCPLWALLINSIDVDGIVYAFKYFEKSDLMIPVESLVQNSSTWNGFSFVARMHKRFLVVAFWLLPLVVSQVNCCIRTGCFDASFIYRLFWCIWWSIAAKSCAKETIFLL